MGMLKNGLLGLGGVGGLMGPDMPMPFEGYDPAAMKRMAIKQAIMQAGLGMLGSQSPNAWGQVADGMRGGLLGVQGAQDAYLRRGLLAEDYKDKKTERARQMKADAWTSTERQHQLDAWNAEDDRRKKMQGYVQSQLGPTTGIPVGQTAQARAYAGMGDYERAAQALVPQMPQSPEPFTLGEGQIRYDGNGRPIAEGPSKQQSPTDDMREYAMAQQQGYKGTFQQYMVDMKRAGASQTNIDMKGQNAYAQERGKGFATRANEIDTAEQSAFKTLNAMGAMKQAMADPNFYSGTGANQIMFLRRLSASMGIDPQSVSSMETFAAQAKQLALDSMGGSLGTGFSNADRDFVTGQVPSLENSPQGNVALMDITERIQKRKIEIARMAREYEQKNGQIDAGFFQELSQWAEQNPLFQDAPAQGGQGGGAPKVRTYNPATGELE